MNFIKGQIIIYAGGKCPVCHGRSRLNTNIFILRLREIYGDDYNFSKTLYNGIRENSICTCNIHGDFERPAYQLLAGYGCRECISKGNNRSKLEDIIYNFIVDKFGDSLKIIRNTKTVLYNNGKNSLLELDLYFPSLNKAIEVNGEYWHKKKERENPGCHKLKHLLCIENNIKLLNIAYNTWFNDPESGKIRIFNFLTQ